MALELDWSLGEFFDADGQYLVCATHGALYDPKTGACIGGACRGRPLQALNTIESDGYIYLEDETYRLIDGSLEVS
jgi:nitrite reductase/ring-hydroxylating ferredoxin subunit